MVDQRLFSNDESGEHGLKHRPPFIIRMPPNDGTATPVEGVSSYFAKTHQAVSKENDGSVHKTEPPWDSMGLTEIRQL